MINQLEVHTEENRYVPENPYVTGVGDYEFMPRLDDSTQYSTVYQGERPVGTIQRRSALDYGRGPIWKLYATDGTLLRAFYLPGSYKGFARRVANELTNYSRKG